MRLLTILIFSFIAFSCAPGGPLTPSDAFHAFKNAIADKSPSAALAILSSRSREKIRVMCSEFSRMDQERRISAAQSMGAGTNELDNITPEKYVALFIIKNPSGSSAGGAFKYKIISVEKKGSSAVVNLDNGMSLPFIKEGPYWRFDLASL